METDVVLDEKNTLTMKLLHYFITEKNYNPILIQGVEDEIWLENLTEDYKVVRIVSGYIHNKEQLDFDKFKTKKILSKIKKKTLSLNINVVSIFLDLSDNIDLSKEENTPNTLLINIADEKDISKNNLLNKIFPDLESKMKYSEEGLELFSRISNDINKHNQNDAKRVEKVFKMKFPLITYILIAINLIFWVVPMFSGNYIEVLEKLATNATEIRNGEYYRLLTGAIMHVGLIHLLVNSYSLYVVGAQMESFLGKMKFLIIYVLSAISGALMSMLFATNVNSVGASGAIFGLLGSMVYFGYHYRVYLGNVLKGQIIPLILANLAIGFIFPGIDNAAHIGGLIGGVLVTMALGIDNKSTKSEIINGWILSGIYFVFLIYMAFVYLA